MHEHHVCTHTSIFILHNILQRDNIIECVAKCRRFYFRIGHNSRNVSVLCIRSKTILSCWHDWATDSLSSLAVLRFGTPEMRRCEDAMRIARTCVRAFVRAFVRSYVRDRHNKFRSFLFLFSFSFFFKLTTLERTLHISLVTFTFTSFRIRLIWAYY